jgi:hypothetical protein
MKSILLWLMIFFYFFIVLRVHCGIYKGSYNISDILYLNSLSPSFSFFLPHPNSGKVSTGLIFPFIYMWTQYLYHSHPPTPFPHVFPLPTGTMFSDFVKKKGHFCLFKIAIQGVSLCHSHVCMYYNLNWFFSSIFLLSTLLFFLW